MKKTFEIGDLVEQHGQNDCILRVSGVIHDGKRLFVTDDSGRFNDGKEFEITFEDVTSQWRKLYGQSSLAGERREIL